jgi:hypothetical protein
MLAPFTLPAGARLAGRPGRRRRFEPRNMAFRDGLDYWELAGSFSHDGQLPGQGYSCETAGQTAVLAATVREPVGSAVLVQAVYADDYRGRAVTFRGQLRTVGLADQAGLHLAVTGPPDGPLGAPPARPRHQPGRSGQRPGLAPFSSPCMRCLRSLGDPEDLACFGNQFPAVGRRAVGAKGVLERSMMVNPAAFSILAIICWRAPARPP